VRVIQERLDEFKVEQLAAFIRAQPKHPEDDVLDDKTDWSKFDVSMLEVHLIEELCEYFEVSEETTQKIVNLLYPRAPGPRNPKEAVDIANMAFLLWGVERATRQKEFREEMKAETS
jgi:hypothetical protein